MILDQCGYICIIWCITGGGGGSAVGTVFGILFALGVIGGGLYYLRDKHRRSQVLEKLESFELNTIKSSFSNIFPQNPAPSSVGSSTGDSKAPEVAPKRPKRPKRPAPVVPKKQIWESFRTDEGEVYYCNQETNETTWDRPAGFEEPISVGLPKGWEELISDKGEVYYHNHDTNETTWERPSSLQ